MKQYLLSIYQPDGDPPPPEILEPIMGTQRGERIRAGGLGAPAAHAGHRRAGEGDQRLETIGRRPRG